MHTDSLSDVGQAIHLMHNVRGDEVEFPYENDCSGVMASISPSVNKDIEPARVEYGCVTRMLVIVGCVGF